MRYVALLRGINVGGNKKVSMANLVQVLAKRGYTNIQTILASGNVLFSTEQEAKVAEAHLEKALNNYFGFTIPVVVCTKDDIEEIAKNTIFKEQTDNSHCFVTFLKKPTQKVTLPYHHPDGGLSILKQNKKVVYATIDRTQGMGTPQLMKTLELFYGKNITTRNLNTLQKIASCE